MPTNDEYENLKAQKRDAQNQYDSAVERIESNEYKIERLKRTKETLSAQKKTFEPVKKSDKKIVDENKRDGWKGECFRSFQNEGDSMARTNDTFYKDSLDGALDAVNNEITRLENLNYNEYGLLGRLSSAINSLANKIENFFN